MLATRIEEWVLSALLQVDTVSDMLQTADRFGCAALRKDCGIPDASIEQAWHHGGRSGPDGAGSTAKNKGGAHTLKKSRIQDR